MFNAHEVDLAGSSKTFRNPKNVRYSAKIASNMLILAEYRVFFAKMTIFEKN